MLYYGCGDETYSNLNLKESIKGHIYRLYICSYALLWRANIIYLRLKASLQQSTHLFLSFILQVTKLYTTYKHITTYTSLLIHTPLHTHYGILLHHTILQTNSTYMEKKQFIDCWAWCVCEWGRSLSQGNHMTFTQT